MTTSKRKQARTVPPVVWPSTPREWALYRVGLSCKIGRDALEGKGPAMCPAVEYALYNLLHAVEDIARAMGPAEASRGEAGGSASGGEA